MLNLVVIVVLVFTLDRKNGEYLEMNDPKGLEQALTTIKASIDREDATDGKNGVTAAARMSLIMANCPRCADSRNRIADPECPWHGNNQY